MYFVDRSKIEETIKFMDGVLKEMEHQTMTTFAEKMSFERLVQVVIESILDTGNMMIDGFIMRDPGSYDDIIDILIDEEVLPKEEETAYKSFIRLRKMIVTEYTEIDHQKLQSAVKQTLPILKSFSSHIRTYLTNELGVANAFTNK